MSNKKRNTDNGVPLDVLVNEKLATGAYVSIQDRLTSEEITAAVDSRQAKEVVPFPGPQSDASENNPVDYPLEHSIDYLSEDYL